MSHLNVFKEICGKFSYDLPTAVISFPRSGSNFLQNVLAASSGLPLRSFHNPSKNMQPLCHYGLKSHAISPNWLADEFKRTTLGYKYPEKIIYIYRDPRDVMISFYEFVQHMKNIKIDQGDFLDKVSYIYATYTDKDPVLGRRVAIHPMSILDAYKTHYLNWFTKPSNSNFHIVKYESLILEPELAFEKIFNFLELDCTLSLDSLTKKVSQYDDKERKRGTVYGWKENDLDYQELTYSVEKELGKEIKSLKYENNLKL